jgi:glutathione S-transferase-like protein
MSAFEDKRGLHPSPDEVDVWEETGRRYGLKPDSGFLLGGEVPGIADAVTADAGGFVGQPMKVVRFARPIKRSRIRHL